MTQSVEHCVSILHKKAKKANVQISHHFLKREISQIVDNQITARLVFAQESQNQIKDHDVKISVKKN